MLFDTHTHPYLPEFDADCDATMKRALDGGVGLMMLPNVDLGTIEPMRRLHEAYPDHTLMAMGLHPTEVDGDWRGGWDKVRQEFLDHPSDYAAIGEIGMDLYWDKTFAAEQMEALARQCDFAVEHALPVIIHCREALPQTLEVLRLLDECPKGVFHSFGGTMEDVDAIRGVGDFYFGINGIVTFKNSKLRDVLPHIGLDRIVVETDAPYLAPVPFRGKRNESAYVARVAQTVADVLGKPVQEVAETTFRNGCTLFNVSRP